MPPEQVCGLLLRASFPGLAFSPPVLLPLKHLNILFSNHTGLLSIGNCYLEEVSQLIQLYF